MPGSCRDKLVAMAKLERSESAENTPVLSRLLKMAALILFGGLLMVAIRFITIRDTSVHYHANFALYVNGQKDPFNSFTFYEEVAACSIDDPDDVKTKVHLHDQNSSLIHVHAHGMTWGQFFNNLGYTLGDKVLVTDKGIFADGQEENHLHFILNGQTVKSLSNRTIKSEDKLLINYGKDDDKTLNDRFNTVPNDAAKANTTADPATCSGSPKLTIWRRLKLALGFGNNTN